MIVTIELYGGYNGTHYFQAGAAGLLQALQRCDNGFAWSEQDGAITIESDNFAADLADLLNQVYQFTADGVLSLFGEAVPVLHNGLLSTTLAIPALRKTGVPVDLSVPCKYGNYPYSVLSLTSTAYNSFCPKLFVRNRLRDSLEVSSWLIPNATGGIEVRSEVAIACLFSSINWLIYDIWREDKLGKIHYSKALICPTNPQLNFRIKSPTEYQDYIAGSLEDAVSHASLINGCEMHGYEYRRKAANRAPNIVKAATILAGEDYADVFEKFPNSGGISEHGILIRSNPLRALAAENLAQGRNWYDRLGDSLSIEQLGWQAGNLRAKLSPQESWKDRTGFEASDYRRGYKAGNAAKARGKSLPELPDNDWGRGYNAGFSANKD